MKCMKMHLIRDYLFCVTGGAKTFISQHPEVGSAIIQVVHESCYGDPNSTRKWYSASNQSIAERVSSITGIHVKRDTGRRFLEHNDYHRQQNAKKEQVGTPDPNRDAQFNHIFQMIDLFVANKWPVYSNDAMNKIPKGNYYHKGGQIRKSKDPRPTLDHDFYDEKYAVYCCYNMTRNHAYFNVTLSHDVPLLAVESQRHALVADMKANPEIKRVLFLTDSGGSDSRRSRVYKALLASLGLELGVEIDVSFYPKGTSKWNPVEHRAFSRVASCCSGSSFTTDEVTVDMLGKVTGKSSVVGIQDFTSQARMDYNVYETKVRVSDEVLTSLPIEQDGGEPGNLGYLNFIFNRKKVQIEGKYTDMVKNLTGLHIDDVFDNRENTGYPVTQKEFSEIIYGCTKAKRLKKAFQQK